MLSPTALKTGVVINIDNTPYEVVRYQHSKMGRGGAVVRTTLKNLVTGNNIERTFHGDEKILPAELERRKAQFLYRQGDDFVLMDSQTFDQFTIPAATVGFAANFLADGQTAELLMFSGNPINLSLPLKMPFKVVEADMAVKGDSATNPLKNSVIETGLTVRVPMFINTGDIILVDTRDGSYIERAK